MCDDIEEYKNIVKRMYIDEYNIRSTHTSSERFYSNSYLDNQYEDYKVMMYQTIEENQKNTRLLFYIYSIFQKAKALV